MLKKIALALLSVCVLLAAVVAANTLRHGSRQMASNRNTSDW